METARRIAGVVLDIGGVLQVGEQPIPGACEALEKLRASGLPHLFLTNTTRIPASALAARLRGMGLAVSVEEILSAPAVARGLLRARGLRPMLLVHPGLRPELVERGLVRKAWIGHALEELYNFAAGERSAAEPYGRRAAPARPLTVDELPRELRPLVERFVFPEVDFARDETFDPRRYVDCFFGEGERGGPARPGQ